MMKWRYLVCIAIWLRFNTEQEAWSAVLHGFQACCTSIRTFKQGCPGRCAPPDVKGKTPTPTGLWAEVQQKPFSPQILLFVTLVLLYREHSPMTWDLSQMWPLFKSKLETVLWAHDKCLCVSRLTNRLNSLHCLNRRTNLRCGTNKPKFICQEMLPSTVHNTAFAFQDTFTLSLPAFLYTNTYAQ